MTSSDNVSTHLADLADQHLPGRSSNDDGVILVVNSPRRAKPLLACGRTIGISNVIVGCDAMRGGEPYEDPVLFGRSLGFTIARLM